MEFFLKNKLFLRAAALIMKREFSRKKARQAILSIDDNVSAVSAEKVEPDLFERIREATGSLEDFLDMSQEEVAEKMNMSKRTLQREFNAAGIKWTELKRLQQVRYSMELLRDTQLSISEVAARCGFSSSSYFSKIFKNETGQPLQFVDDHLIKKKIIHIRLKTVFLSLEDGFFVPKVGAFLIKFGTQFVVGGG